jgi:hypothetical protein
MIFHYGNVWSDSQIQHCWAVQYTEDWVASCARGVAICAVPEGEGEAKAC